MLSREDYKAIFEALPDGCLVVDAGGTIRGANPRSEALFGWKATELVGRAVEELIPDASRAGHSAHRKAYAETPHDRPMGAGLDLKGQRRDGTTFSAEVSLSPWRGEGGDLQVICLVRDVSEYRRLQDFSEAALRASEEERQRIARELHDDTAQRLATLILRIRVLAEETDLVCRRRLLEDVRAEIVDAAESVKRMARGLRPPEIEELGLSLAMQAHARNLEEAGSFSIQADLGVVDPYLDVTAKLALYRIIQEAISNARRHSGAETAIVRLAYEDDSVVTEIEDHGSGFASATVMEGSRGLGLVGMSERASMIGGRLTIDAVPGEGTRVRVVVPVGPLESKNG